MQYIHIETGEYPVTQDQIRARNPSTLFPDPFAPVDGYAQVEFGTVPAFDPATHKAVEAAPSLTDGKWVQVWDVVALTEGEITKRARDAKAAATSATLQTIISLETAAHVASQRLFREAVVGMMEKEAAALGITSAQLAAKNKGYKGLKEFDQQIAALRSQLT